jgi:osmotically-inducible protein OsmY
VDPAYLLTHIRAAVAETVGELGIGIEIQRQVVFLSGVVSNDERRRRIEVVVRSLCEGHEVVNEISVRPPQAPDAPEQVR